MIGEFPGVSLKKSLLQRTTMYVLNVQQRIKADIPLAIQLRFSATKPMESGYFPLLPKVNYSLILIYNVHSITCGNTSVKQVAFNIV